jgi:hypothetical protein
MTIALYMDAHIRSAITAGLRNRGVTIVTAQEDGCDRLSDPDLLDRATALGYVLFTSDTDFLVEAARRQRAGENFAGVVYAHALYVPIGKCIDDLELIAKINDPPDMVDRVMHLPL